ncbi:HumD family translesion DNA polymerase [Enterobacter hormaechei]|uniref:HumD family translesion DNA polymerase n=1 Tax=Enterobacter hormaechei TaxID=158836 RepID=UPI0026EACABE|nr:S24 family peptidase [Enterobacter hormaechei]
MAFPSPAADFAESRISLDRLLISHPSATYYLRAGESYRRPGIHKGALLVVDSSLCPCDGSIIVCDMGGEFRLKQYRKLPSPHLENLANGAREELPESDAEGNDAVFGVVTYIINDGRVGEFDDNPVI